jgi:hypothetical protein
MSSGKKNGSDRMMQPMSGSSLEAWSLAGSERCGRGLHYTNGPVSLPEGLPCQAQRQVDELGEEFSTRDEVAGECSLNRSGSPMDSA